MGGRCWPLAPDRGGRGTRSAISITATSRCAVGLAGGGAAGGGAVVTGDLEAKLAASPVALPGDGLLEGDVAQGAGVEVGLDGVDQARHAAGPAYRVHVDAGEAGQEVLDGDRLDGAAVLESGLAAEPGVVEDPVAGGAAHSPRLGWAPLGLWWPSIRRRNTWRGRMS